MVYAAMPPRRDAGVAAFRAASETEGGGAVAMLLRASCRPTRRPRAKVSPRITTTAPPSITHWRNPGPPPDRRRGEAIAQSRSAARVMLSGADTPSRSSPLRTTWATAAQSPRRASVVARSGPITRCAL